MQFKTMRDTTEYGQLQVHNKRLWTLLRMLDEFTQMEFNKEIVITHVLRTKEEHEALYKETPPDKRPATSPHMRWEAVDIRSSNFTDIEISRMLEFLNCFRYQGGTRKVAIHHLIAGNTWHTHIQYK